jgi:hypothetical protein
VRCEQCGIKVEYFPWSTGKQRFHHFSLPMLIFLRKILCDQKGPRPALGHSLPGCSVCVVTLFSWSGLPWQT